MGYGPLARLGEKCGKDAIRRQRYCVVLCEGCHKPCRRGEEVLREGVSRLGSSPRSCEMDMRPSVTSMRCSSFPCRPCTMYQAQVGAETFRRYYWSRTWRCEKR